MPSIESLLEKLSNCESYTATKEERKNLEQSFDEMWMNFLQHIDDPDIQELIKSFSNFGMADDTFGWQLSVENAMRVKMQRPDATFVQTESQWMDLFNREVKPNSRYILVVVPYSMKNRKYNTQAERKSTMKDAGYSDEVKFSDLTTQQKEFVDITAASWRGNGKFFIMKYYDISDTQLASWANEDNWSNEAGFENNLTGSLNGIAKVQKDESGAPNEEELQQKLYGDERGNIKKASESLIRGVAKNFPDIKLVNPTTTTDERMVKNIYQQNLVKVADFMIERKLQIVKPENREHASHIAAVFVMCLTKVSPVAVARRLANNELTMNEYMSLRDVINSIITMINRNVTVKETYNYIKEGMYPTLGSVDDMLSMMGMDRDDVKPENDEDESSNSETELAEEGKQIREEFYRVYNKINKLLF
jgi:hypothetical protein